MIPWSTPKNWIAGAVLPASDLNTHLRDQLLVLRGGGIAIPSQAADDFVRASSTTQLTTITATDMRLWWEVYVGS